ncbi:extensin family protein [Pacificoceanicola onchidii]|uniref:extensin-like domain-containing protein n=1 Tax=Pacificoceanicola onchidii TaxID=2562685 RepID=UPI001F0F33CA|nr:extensin family protein [Pacificoceanicola onchidii]
MQQAFASSRNSTVEGGGLCGDPLLIGEPIGDVPGSGVCGVEDAVRLRAVGDVALSQPATINCRTARALSTWVETGAKPAVGKRGGGLSRLHVSAHYVCRTRNHQPGARISEHGKGNAIDINAVYLQDGTEISVLRDWGGGKNGKALKAMHKSACGTFGTVLGPNSDRFHKDHFHFDTAQYRSGSYCR